MKSLVRISLISRHQVRFEVGGLSEIFEGWDIVNKVPALRRALLRKDVEQLLDPVVLQAYMCISSLQEKAENQVEPRDYQPSFHVIDGLDLLSKKETISKVAIGKTLICLFGTSFVIGPVKAVNTCQWCYEYLISQFHLNVFGDGDFEIDSKFASDFALRINLRSDELVAFNGVDISRCDLVQVMGCECTKYA